MNRLTIRLATGRDIDALIDIYIEFHEFHVRGVPDQLRIPETYDRLELQASLKRIISGSTSAIFLAEIEDAVAGLAEVYLRQSEPDPAVVTRKYGYLQSLMVLEPYRQHGIGSQLVEAVEQWAKEQGASEMHLDTWEFAAGPLRFYEALGYRTLKRTMTKHIDQ